MRLRGSGRGQTAPTSRPNGRGVEESPASCFRRRQVSTTPCPERVMHPSTGAPAAADGRRRSGSPRRRRARPSDPATGRDGEHIPRRRSVWHGSVRCVLLGSYRTQDRLDLVNRWLSPLIEGSDPRLSAFVRRHGRQVRTVVGQRSRPSEGRPPPTATRLAPPPDRSANGARRATDATRREAASPRPQASPHGVRCPERRAHASPRPQASPLGRLSPLVDSSPCGFAHAVRPLVCATWEAFDRDDNTSLEAQKALCSAETETHAQRRRGYPRG